MTERIQHGSLAIARELHELVNNEIIPGTGIAPDAFWSSFEQIVDRLEHFIARRAGDSFDPFGVQGGMFPIALGIEHRLAEVGEDTEADRRVGVGFFLRRRAISSRSGPFRRAHIQGLKATCGEQRLARGRAAEGDHAAFARQDRFGPDRVSEGNARFPQEVG